MKTEEILAIVLELLADVAPELEDMDFRADQPFREQLDIDSFDQLSFLSALSERFAVPISDKDALALVSVDDCCAFIERGLAGAS